MLAGNNLSLNIQRFQLIFRFPYRSFTSEASKYHWTNCLLFCIERRYVRQNLNYYLCWSQGVLHFFSELIISWLIFYAYVCTQLTFTCSKSIETLEKGVKYAQSSQWKHQKDIDGVVQVFLSLTLNIFYTFFYCFYCCIWTSKCLLGNIWLFLFTTIFCNLSGFTSIMLSFNQYITNLFSSSIFISLIVFPEAE